MLADEGNFTRAADRPRITQPALSKRIAELECRLGFTVFKREQKGVELTEAGQVFLRGCKDSLAILEKAVRTARATQEEIQPVVTIGHSPYVEPSLVSVFLGIHLPLYPGLRLRMESMFAHDLIHGVLSAELDMAIVEEPSENPLLTLVPLMTVPLVALMSSDHAAAQQRDLQVEHFSNVGWMIFPKRANPITYERFMALSKQVYVAPVELHHYTVPQEVLPLISENFGIAIMPKGIAEQMESPGYSVRPFSAEALRVTSYLVLRADQTSRLVNEFGRAFLKKVTPGQNSSGSSGQLPFKW